MTDMPDRSLIKGKSAEPWVELANGSAFELWQREDEIAYNQVNRQTEKYRFFRGVFDFLKENNVEGDYHEYGCHRCRTFRMALTEARRHDLEAMKFFAFDSFSGLPQPSSDPSQRLWSGGALTTSREQFLNMVREHGIYADRVVTVEGYYANSLTAELRAQFAAREKPIALATIDCDLYESAKPVFEFIEPLLQEGSVLYIDDMFAGYKGSPAKGVARAFREFRQTSRFSFVRHMDIGWWGRAFIAYEEDDPKQARIGDE